MSKFLGFLLGVVVALVGPAMFGVLAAAGGIELNAKEMALAYGIGALIFWTVVSYFSGAAALGAALTFGAMIYAVHWIPNRMTNFLNDVPGVTTGMIEGVKQYTLNGVVPILAVISLVYAIQSIVRAVQQRRRERAEAERLQREQEAAQAQQEADTAAAYPAAGGGYPVAGGDYPTSVDNRFGSRGNTSYDDLFDEDPTPYPPRDEGDDQTAQYANADDDDSRADAEDDDRRAEADDETVLVPTDRGETVQVPAASSDDEATDESRDEAGDENAGTAGRQQAVDEADEVTVQEPRQQVAGESVAEGTERGDDETRMSPPVPPGASGFRTPEPPSSRTSSNTDPSGGSAGGTGGYSSPSGAAPTGSAESQGSQGPNASAPNTTPAAPKPGVQAPEGRSGPELPRNEEVGQQYRERMDGPEVDETGEYHFGAFENPTQPEENRPQAPRVMDLPGQFRPAGA